MTGSQPGRTQAVLKMAIFSVYVVNKAGGLIYQYDNYVPRTEVEKTFSHPLDLVLKHHDEKVLVSFGQRDGIKGNILPQTLYRFMLQTMAGVLFDVLLWTQQNNIFFSVVVLFLFLFLFIFILYFILHFSREGLKTV